jgi:spore germination cell wall hydrolase CwlJ-like protein
MCRYFKVIIISFVAFVALANSLYAEQHKVHLSAEEMDALARVAYAEAGNQGSKGIAAVISTVLNRLHNGHFGASLFDVINAKHQFEPVTKAGGWEQLPKPSSAQIATVKTIVDLMQDGTLSDVTKGALYFQNPKIVKTRVQEGKVSSNLLHFGGENPDVVIGDHAFYRNYKGKSVTSRYKKNYTIAEMNPDEERANKSALVKKEDGALYAVDGGLYAK